MTDVIPFREQIFCSINEAVQATATCRSTIYQLIKAGRIRTVRFGGRRKIVVASLLELAGDDASEATAS
jgi:excisionase family DNA binding protein